MARGVDDRCRPNGADTQCRTCQDRDHRRRPAGTKAWHGFRNRATRKRDGGSRRPAVVSSTVGQGWPEDWREDRGATAPVRSRGYSQAHPRGEATVTVIDDNPPVGVEVDSSEPATPEEDESPFAVLEARSVPEAISDETAEPF